MKILLATPTYDNFVHQHYHASVMRLMIHYTKRYPHIVFDSLVNSGTLIERARNGMASRIIHDSSYTHLLFVDADMGFQPSLIEKMLAFDRPVVGCIYPNRQSDFDKLYESARQMPDAESARLLAQPFALERSLIEEPAERGRPARYRVVRGFVRVDRLGTGIMLIQRAVFDQVKERYPELWVQDPGTEYKGFPWCKDGVLQCFAPYQQPNNLFLSEDMSFSARWVKGCGGELWACITDPITHVGREYFSGAYAEKLRLRRSAPSEAGRGLGPDPAAAAE